MRIRQGVVANDIEFVGLNAMQKHVDAAEVIGRDVDFLTEKAAIHAVLAEDFHGFQEQRAAAASGIVDLIDLLLADGAEFGQELRHLGGSEELASGLAGIRRIHRHQIFIGVAEGIDIMIFHRSEFHVGNAV